MVIIYIVVWDRRDMTLMRSEIRNFQRLQYIWEKAIFYRSYCSTLRKRRSFSSRRVNKRALRLIGHVGAEPSGIRDTRYQGLYKWEDYTSTQHTVTHTCEPSTGVEVCGRHVQDRLLVHHTHTNSTLSNALIDLYIAYTYINYGTKAAFQICYSRAQILRNFKYLSKFYPFISS